MKVGTFISASAVVVVKKLGSKASESSSWPCASIGWIAKKSGAM